MKTNPRVVVAVVAVIVVAASTIGYQALKGGAGEAPEKIDHITIAVYAGDSSALIYIAQEEGFFSMNGLDVTLKEYQAGKLACDAMLAGESDFCTCSEFVIVANSFDRSDLRMLSTVSLAQVNELVAREDAGITDLSDLRGKRIGTTKSSIAEFYLGRLLAQEDMSLADVTVVDMKPGDIAGQIEQRSIDAALTWLPFSDEVKKQLGENARWWPAQSNRDFYFMLVSTKSVLGQNPEAAGKLMKAIVLAEDFVRQNEDRAKEIVFRKFEEQGRSCFEDSWRETDFEVKLPQALLSFLDEEAAWRIDNGLSPGPTIPNYLNFIYPQAIESVKPEAITVILGKDS